MATVAVMPAPPATATIAGVELVKVGTWAASTGVTTVTAGDLAAMVAAAGDAEVDRAPIKLGHTGALSDLGDSEPALGFVENLRLSDDGQTLLGDIVDVPAALEAPLRKAYPRRSVEIAWGVKTPAGNAYAAAISALALLGVSKPAVKGLADLADLYATATTAANELDVDHVTALAMWDVAPDEPTRAERVENQLRWAKEAAASLAAITGLVGLQGVFDALDAMAVGDSRSHASEGGHLGPDAQSPGSRGGLMADTLLEQARKALDLPDDADDAAVLSALAELKTKVDEPAGGEGGEGDEKVPVGAAALSAETIEALKAAGLTVVTTTAFAALEEGAKAGAAAKATIDADARKRVLDEAERAGKFGAGDAAKATRTHFAGLLETNFDGTKAVLDSLPATVPTSFLGTAEQPALDALSEADIDKALAELLGGDFINEEG